MDTRMRSLRFKEDRTTEAASYLLKLHGGKMEHIKLIKLLYLADREAFENWERPITYDTYFSMKNGQVLSNTLDLVNSNIEMEYWDKYIKKIYKNWVGLENQEFKIKKLTKSELKLLEKIYSQFGSWDWRRLIDYTHTLPEFERPDPITSRVETTLDKLLAALNYDDRDIERITQKLEEFELIDNFFVA